MGSLQPFRSCPRKPTTVIPGRSRQRADPKSIRRSRGIWHGAHSPSGAAEYGFRVRRVRRRPGMTAGVRHRPYSLVGPGQALVAKSNSALPSRGAERRQTRRGARPPVGGWRNTPDGTLARRLVPPSIGGTRLPALHLRRSATRTGRAFENVDQPRLSASSWRQVLMPASGAPPSPECFGVRCSEARGAASVDGGISPVIDPARSGRISGPVLAAAPSSRRPMTTPLEEQDRPMIGISA